jgi:hypothetical protein
MVENIRIKVFVPRRALGWIEVTKKWGKGTGNQKVANGVLEFITLKQALK